MSDIATKKAQLLDDFHWKREDYVQRMDAKEWRWLLLNSEDKIIFNGNIRKLIGRNLGYGVVDVSKAPLPPDLPF